MERSDERSIIYEKLPSDIAKRHVLLLDPILATGNSAVEAINILLTRGVPEKHIILVTLICAPKVPQPPAPRCHRSRTTLALSACGTGREGSWLLVSDASKWGWPRRSRRACTTYAAGFPSCA